MPTRRGAGKLGALLVLLVLPAGSAAQETADSADVRDPLASVGRAAGGAVDEHAGAPGVAAAAATGAIVIDGRLDDDAWQAAEPATDFTQTDPLEGRPATQRTEVRFLYDEHALYVGARMHDEAGGVRSRLGRRDSFVNDSDWLYLAIDSHHDHRTSYQFNINPAGVKRDETGGDASWNAVWDGATTVDDRGWTAELRIPFSQLRFVGAGEQTWGVQITRRINRRQEVTVFAFTPKSERGGVARYGHLTGLRGVRPGRRLEALPYTLARAEYVRAAPDNPFRDGSDFTGGAGLDLKYRLSGGLTLDATVNPDFGQVELDPAVVNLSAFETSFDEKRPFFLEGVDILRFGETRLFYSRRIGRQPQGTLPSGVAFSDPPDASTILGAAKLSGRTPGGWSIGLVAALTDEESAAWQASDGAFGTTVVEPRSAHLVGRLRRDLRAGRTVVGGIVTAVHRDLDAGSALDGLLRSEAFVGGVDFTHEFADRAWSVNGWLAHSLVRGSAASITRTQRSSARYFQRPDAGHVDVDSALTNLTGYAAQLEIGKRAGLHWRGEARVTAISPGYEINDLGFQTTVDRVSADGNLTYLENAPGPVLRSWRATLSTSGDWNYDRDFVGGNARLRVEGQFLNYWNANASLTRSFRAWDDRLTRGGPVALDPPGQHVSLNLNSDSRGRVSGRLNASYSWGESGGWHRHTSAGLSLYPASNWSISAGPRLDRSHSAAQFLGSVADAAMTSTFGRRYLFAPLDQTTLSIETRLNFSFTPDLSVEVYAQPFISSGEYGRPAQLGAPRTFDFDTFGRDAGTADLDADAATWTIDPDAAGPAAPFTLADRSFTNRSLRGNLVARWEWRPGSTLFIVWQQRRQRSADHGDFDFGRDAADLFRARPENVFLVKLNYWLNL